MQKSDLRFLWPFMPCLVIFFFVSFSDYVVKDQDLNQKAGSLSSLVSTVITKDGEECFG